MAEVNPHIKHLLNCIDLEEKEEVARYRLDKEHALRQLKSEGLALHPIRVLQKNFGYADYPEISFHIKSILSQHQFKDGCAIELFYLGEEPIKGILRQLNGKVGEIRLFAPDYPEWIDEDSVGIKLSPDTRTNTIMRKGLHNIEKHPVTKSIFDLVYETDRDLHSIEKEPDKEFLYSISTNFNKSQKKAIDSIIHPPNDILIVHGPPGTGKTSTLVEAVKHLVTNKKRILISAPSNTAVDHFAKSLLLQGIKFLRIGNSTKVHESIYPFTTEGSMENPKIKKEIKELKIRAEEFRRMALKYKRKFGKSEREQRKLLFEEVKKIRAEIKNRISYHETKLFHESGIVLGTPVAIVDANFGFDTFDYLFIDEAGQCIEPLAWCIMPFAKQFVLAGDYLQLPPTILSAEAKRKGFEVSILEKCMKTLPSYLLNTQYRMRDVIASFSSEYFYKGKLLTASNLISDINHFTFIDTVGAGYEEERGPDGYSLINQGEITIIQQLIEQEKLIYHNVGFISPYSAQVELAYEKLPSEIRKHTIDSFQGQEMDTIIISLVRSNDEGEIGFLKDYRRMNVAITRAKNNLYIIGDSLTLRKNVFFQALLDYVEKKGAYRSAYEWMI
jgi:predicted DNA helicase